MDESNTNRKHIRLKGYDYSQSGYYYVTICTHYKLPILSRIQVARGLAPAIVELSHIGQTVEEQLLDLPNRYPHISIDKYTLMPNHVHVIIVIKEDTEAASPAALTDVVCSFKSLSTRLCNQNDNTLGRKIWQSSFYDEIIRSEDAYQKVWEYIDSNHLKWMDDAYFLG